ncbi:protein-tyrosine phosphatase family protein [Bacillus subtilis]|nr:protein-tyrosine phosphatase family protein [Bacillus subtilis]
MNAIETWESGDGVVEFHDGRRVRGRGLLAQVPNGLDPQFGVYLLGHAPSIDRWPHRWVLWQDFSLPASTAAVIAALHEAYARAEMERVEIACDGGMGRTGTALAALAIISGIPTNDAVDWVREHYHPQAVETRHQRRWISDVSSQLRT